MTADAAIEDEARRLCLMLGVGPDDLIPTRMGADLTLAEYVEHASKGGKYDPDALVKLPRWRTMRAQAAMSLAIQGVSTAPSPPQPVTPTAQLPIQWEGLMRTQHGDTFTVGVLGEWLETHLIVLTDDAQLWVVDKAMVRPAKGDKAMPPNPGAMLR